MSITNIELSEFLKKEFLNKHQNSLIENTQPIVDFIKNCLSQNSFLGTFNMVPQILMRNNGKMLNFLINWRVFRVTIEHILPFIFFNLMGNCFFLFLANPGTKTNSPIVFFILSIFIVLPLFVYYSSSYCIKKFIV